jgi:hypothetical protein
MVELAEELVDEGKMFASQLSTLSSEVDGWRTSVSILPPSWHGFFEIF